MNLLGLTAIGSYIPEGRRSNYDRMVEFGIDASFIENRIGVRRVAVKQEGEQTSDLCVAAFRNLQSIVAFNPLSVDALVVVTQNPDQSIPHTLAIVHGKLDLPARCACFDISLGCSGYVYGLSILLGFMEHCGLGTGLLFTADPYSPIIDPTDKNTALLFGDAATVSLVDHRYAFRTVEFTFGTAGTRYEDLCRQGQTLSMNGRSIYDFIVENVPRDIQTLLDRSHLSVGAIDRFLFHQGSRHLVETLAKRLKIDPARAPYKIEDYGNTVSSSIPLLLKDELVDRSVHNLVISGFGVGLSWASAVLTRAEGLSYDHLSGGSRHD